MPTTQRASPPATWATGSRVTVVSGHPQEAQPSSSCSIWVRLGVCARKPTSLGRLKGAFLRAGSSSWLRAEDSVLVDRLAEELAVEPRHLSGRQRLVLSSGAFVLLALALLTSDRLVPVCGQQPDQPSEPARARPWIPAGDPRVRDLHYQLLDRAATAKDDPRSGALPKDVRGSARRIGDVEGVTLYLGAGPGFACLGADHVRVYDNTAKDHSSECLLNTTIVNQGLTLSFTPDGSEDSVLVIAVPDGMELITTPSTTRLATYPNAVVLRPGTEPIYLQAPGQTPIDLHVDADETLDTWSC